MHWRVVSPELRNVLLDLMADPDLQQFVLVGGTSLALRFGHRRSEDIDLFIDQSYDAEAVGARLSTRHGLENLEVTRNSIRGTINTVRLDVIAHRYPWLAPVDFREEVRMAGIEDVAAMKLNAVTNRGCKKDFWDVACLLEHRSLRDLLTCFQRKYPQSNVWHVEKSLVFFEDADGDPNPVDLAGWTWDDVKDRIRTAFH